MVFTPCEAKQALRGLGLQEREGKKEEKDTGKLFRNGIKKKDVCA